MLSEKGTNRTQVLDIKQMPLSSSVENILELEKWVSAKNLSLKNKIIMLGGHDTCLGRQRQVVLTQRNPVGWGREEGMNMNLLFQSLVLSH